METNRDVLLRIDNLSLSFGGVQALIDVSMDIRDNDILAIIGPNGAGKTVLAKACLGLLPANAELGGQILLDRQEIDFSDEAALNRIRWKRLSMVIQDGAASLNPV